MIRDVVLMGPLADKFGKDPIRFDADDVGMLFSGLECAYPGFRSELSRQDELALVKRRNGKLVSVPEEQFGMRFGGADTIIIATRTRGSAESIAAWAVTALGATGTAATVVSAITYVAVSVAISFATAAVMKALSDSPDPAQERDKRESRLFNGPQNVREQGGGIAKIYGKHRVGGTIISSEITTERLSMLMPDSFTFTAGSSATRNVKDNDILRERLTITAWTIDGTSRAVGYTHTKAETVTEKTDPFSGQISPGTQDGYSFSLASTGVLSVTSQAFVAVTHELTYTATDSSDGSTATATVTLKIQPTTQWNNDTGGDGAGNEGGAAPGGTASAGDGNAGDGGTGGGDGSGSGGGTASA